MEDQPVYAAHAVPDDERAREVSDLHADPDAAAAGGRESAAEAGIPWRVAKALLKLRD